MRDYFLRRFLLIPPTLLGITLIVFLITRLVPGGPLERAIMEYQQVQAGSGGGGSGGASGGGMGGPGSAAGGAGGQSMALSDEQLQQLKAYYGFDKPAVVSYGLWLGKVARGDLGSSYRYNEPVWQVIRERFPVSLFYGLITLVVTYAVSIPLGILKAIKHRSAVDNATSVLIFMGYAVPGYVLGALLLLFFAARLEWFPMGGFVSYDFPDLSLAEKVGDLAQHAALPLLCYLVGSFAVTTLLMKNHLMDNLAADYVRTAIAKGVSFRAAVLRHACATHSSPLPRPLAKTSRCSSRARS